MRGSAARIPRPPRSRGREAAYKLQAQLSPAAADECLRFRETRDEREGEEEAKKGIAILRLQLHGINVKQGMQ